MASSTSTKTTADLYGVEIVVDEKGRKKYKKGKFLGKVWSAFLSWFSQYSIPPPSLSHSHTHTHMHTPFQGGFARCYELVDIDTNKVYAGKIVAKSLLTKSHQKEKVHLT